MAPVYSSSNDAGRESPVRVVRRQLITARGSQEMPTPRVVLHMPDLDALQTVALGPVRPTSRRRIDAAHKVEPTSSRTAGNRDAERAADSDANETNEAAAHPLLNLIRVPLGKWLAPVGGGKFSVGSMSKWVVMMQQPKMLLGAIVAVAMQLAAVLAMIGGGNSSNDKHAGSDHAAHSHGDSANHGLPQRLAEQHADHRHGPIRTPLSMPSSGGQPFAGPALMPAPQPLAGVDAKDVPPWQAPVSTLPPPAANRAPARSETVAAPPAAPISAPNETPVLSGPTNAATSLGGASGPSIGTGNVMIGRPDVSNASASGPTNVVQASTAKAKLRGTIQRKPTTGANP